MRLTFMINITLATEFVLPPRGGRWVLVRSRQAHGFARRAERGGTVKLSPLLAVTSVPPMLAGLTARSVVAFGGSFTVSRRNQPRDMRRPAPVRWRASSAAIRELWPALARGPLVRGRNADHL